MTHINESERKLSSRIHPIDSSRLEMKERIDKKDSDFTNNQEKQTDIESNDESDDDTDDEEEISKANNNFIVNIRSKIITTLVTTIKKVP